MHANPQRAATFRAHELRREGGRWLKEKREQANLSQRQLAAKVGAEYYTLISQLETGRGKVASDQYLIWAGALNISPQEFAHAMMRFYDLRDIVQRAGLHIGHRVMLCPDFVGLSLLGQPLGPQLGHSHLDGRHYSKAIMSPMRWHACLSNKVCSTTRAMSSRNSASATGFEGGRDVSHQHNPHRRIWRRVWRAYNLPFGCSADPGAGNDGVVYCRAEYKMACFPGDRRTTIPLISSSSAAASIRASSSTRVVCARSLLPHCPFSSACPSDVHRFAFPSASRR